uniref:HRAS-like suppressor 2 isoform X2 n=1 Tax=Urocitellus parryii TaxID=9999 RepID=UPI000E56076D|nr:HRAS-like suppressor 2 isoform X2 [Urocitellus parryii]
MCSLQLVHITAPHSCDADRLPWSLRDTPFHLLLVLRPFQASKHMVNGVERLPTCVWSNFSSLIPQDRTRPKRGDLIEIFRGTFEHWAIYVGKGYVVHLTSPSEAAGPSVSGLGSVLGNRAIVKKELLSVVAGGNKYRVNNKNDNKYEPQPPDKIVQQAEEMVGKYIRYSLTENNCEHFVNKLRYGVSRSDQVINGIITFVITILFGVPGFAFRAVARKLRNS